MKYRNPIPPWLQQARKEQLQLATASPALLESWAYRTIENIRTWLLLPHFALTAGVEERQELYDTVAKHPPQTDSPPSPALVASIKELIDQEHAEDTFLQYSFDAADLFLYCLETLEYCSSESRQLAHSLGIEPGALTEACQNIRTHPELSLPWRGCCLAGALAECLPLSEGELYDAPSRTDNPFGFLLAHYCSYWAARA